MSCWCRCCAVHTWTITYMYCTQILSKIRFAYGKPMCWYFSWNTYWRNHWQLEVNDRDYSASFILEWKCACDPHQLKCLVWTLRFCKKSLKYVCCIAQWQNVIFAPASFRVHVYHNKLKMNRHNQTFWLLQLTGKLINNVFLCLASCKLSSTVLQMW